METIYITRRERFNSAHKLFREDWTEEKNKEVFGKCSNHNWHGHNYILYVTVKGIPNPDTGFVINLKTLSKIINKEIIDQLDHRNMNLDVPFLNGVIPSTENVVIKIWDRIFKPISDAGGELAKIKLFETENNFVEYFGGRKPF